MGGCEMVDSISGDSALSSTVVQGIRTAASGGDSTRSPESNKVSVESLELSAERIAQIAKVANATLEAANNSLRFRIDESVKRPIVSVVDQESGQVIRQLPSEELVRISQSIESMRGILFDTIT